MIFTNPILRWINSTRIRVYPRLFLVTIWAILAINLVLHDGWLGRFGQLIGVDFLVFYSTGLIYRTDPYAIYDFSFQIQSQQELVSPTLMSGFAPYSNPPYVAPILSLLTHIPLTWAFFLWTITTVILVIASVLLLMRVIPDQIKQNTFTFGQFLIVVFSFFPLVESIQAGQNSGLTFFLITCLLYLTLHNHHFLAGVISGMIIYKPQYILGFLILWLVWKNYKALLGFGLTTFLWVGSFFIIRGPDLFQDYFEISQSLLHLPYVEGWPGYIQVTLYGFLTTIFPQSAQPILSTTSQAVLAASCLILAVIAYQLRGKTIVERTPAIVLALLVPLLGSPYALLHDLVILIPGFVLWSRYRPNRELLIPIISIYLGSFFLTIIGALTHIALVALLIIGLISLVLFWIFKHNSRELQSQS